MPLVLIDVIRGHDEAWLGRLMDVVHESVVAAFQVPGTDRYQILSQHEPFEIRVLDTGLGFERSNNVVLVRLISKPRSVEAKQRLYQLLAEGLETTLGVSGQDLIVTLVENTDADWSFGQGAAQFVTGAL